jgi:MATE family multidrug resistance protein
MLMCVFSYWVVGFPLAYFLGIQQMRGPIYVWLGLIAGLTVCSLLLLSRYLLRTRQSVMALAVPDV